MCDVKIGKICKIQALFPWFLLLSGPGSWAGLHPPEYVTWPLLVDLMLTRVSVEGFTQCALKWGYLPTNPVVSTADAIGWISRCSKTPGLAKSGAGGCLTADLMNRKRSDTILTYAWSDYVLRSYGFQFFSCLNFNSFPFPLTVAVIITLSFPSSLPPHLLYSLTSSWFGGI